MKSFVTLLLCSLISTLSLFGQETGGSIDAFLKDHKGYKKVSLEENITKDLEKNWDYSEYFIDDAYRVIRGKVIITVLVRKKIIMGYHLICEHSGPNADLIYEAVEKVYNSKKMKKTKSANSYSDDKRYFKWIFIDSNLLAKAKNEEIADLRELVRP